MWFWFLRHTEWKSYGVTETSTKISEGMDGQAKLCDRSQSLPGAPKWVMLKAVRVKPKVQWRPQNVRDDRNVESHLKKAAEKLAQERGHVGYDQ